VHAQGGDPGGRLEGLPGHSFIRSWGLKRRIIGAAAAVGLNAAGWYGRFIEFGLLRQHLRRCGWMYWKNMASASWPWSVTRPRPKTRRPRVDPKLGEARLLGGQPVLPVVPQAPGLWETMAAAGAEKKRRPSIIWHLMHPPLPTQRSRFFDRP